MLSVNHQPDPPLDQNHDDQSDKRICIAHVLRECLQGPRKEGGGVKVTLGVDTVHCPLDRSSAHILEVYDGIQSVVIFTKILLSVLLYCLCVGT